MIKKNQSFTRTFINLYKRFMESHSPPKQNKNSNHHHHQTKFDKLRSALDQEVYKKWEEEQIFLRTKLIEQDDLSWSLKDKTLKYIGGVDLSFSKTDKDMACSYLVVMSYPDFKVVYKDHEIVRLDAPYIPGFLAFREVPHLLHLIDRLRNTKPEFLPQVILVDGNGIFHQNGFGLASHLGVLANIPTIGCGKTVFFVDGISSDKVRQLCEQNLHKGGDSVKLVGNSGRVWGAALRSTDSSTDPVIVSVGHRISLDTTLALVKSCCKFRVPEPIRVADIESRVLVKDTVKKGIVGKATNKMVFEKDDPSPKNQDPVEDDGWTTIKKK